MAKYSFTTSVWVCIVICCVCLCDVTESRFIVQSRDSNSVDPICAKVRCRQMPINCVDFEESDEGCCGNTKICPNGPNCWYNGELISGRGIHKVRDYETGCQTICSCPPPWRVVYDRQTQANCNEHCPSRRE